MTRNLKILFISVIAGLIAVIGGFIFYNSLFGAPQVDAKPERFVVPLGQSSGDTVEDLYEEGFIKNKWGFGIVLGPFAIKPGGYELSKNMNVWQVAEALENPYMEWVTIPEGLRKEEIAAVFKDKLGWSETDKGRWISDYTALDFDHTEGVYFPDTYLIPKNESPFDVAKRLRARFEEKFASYADDAAKQNIKWTTVLKLASLIQREAAGKNDMPLIAGILWNRLNIGMRLEVDATLQYIKGNEQVGWWPKVIPSDKQIDSPYNTYKFKGLPPHPISNPGIDAISAALNPAKTDCLFYLHDGKGDIHCAKTYSGHKENIEQFLK